MDRTRTLVVRATSPDSTFAERHEAFGELVRLFQDMACACAYAVLGDFHAAEDAAQEAFVTAWRKLDRLREPEAFPGWLRRIVLTECNRLTRRRRLRTVPLEPGAGVPSTEVDQQGAVERDYMKRALTCAVGALPRGERMVVALFYADGRSHKDIARFLEVPTTTVARRLNRARTRLKGRLSEDFKDAFAGRRPSRSMTFADKVRAGIFDAYVGRYRYELRPDLVVTIKREGARLFGEAAGQRNEIRAGGESEGDLRVEEFDGRGEFTRDARGRVTHFTYYEFGRQMGRALKIG